MAVMRQASAAVGVGGGMGGWRRSAPMNLYEEFQESDMWDLMVEGQAVIEFKVNSNESDLWDLMVESQVNIIEQPDDEKNNDKKKKKPPMGLLSRNLAATARVTIAGGDNNKKEKPNNKVVQQHSAPVNIPDWSKIYGRSPRKKLGRGDVGVGGNGGHDDDWLFGEGDKEPNNNEAEDDDEDDYGDGEWVAPHEWVARKDLARKKIPSPFSVCEGAGRTLKGRDLTTVRDAILTRTGFI